MQRSSRPTTLLGLCALGWLVGASCVGARRDDAPMFSTRASAPTAAVDEHNLEWAPSARHRGVTDRATTGAAGITVRLLDARLQPMPDVRLQVVDDKGITDDSGRLRTSVQAIHEISSLDFAVPGTDRYVTTIRRPNPWDVRDGELLVRMPALREVALRVVDSAGQSMPRARIVCVGERDFTPDEHGLLLFPMNIPVVPEDVEALSDDHGIVRFTAPEGVYRIAQRSADEWSPCAWLVVTRGDAPIEGTLVVPPSAGERRLLVRVDLPPGARGRSRVEVVAVPQQHVFGANELPGDNLHCAFREASAEPGRRLLFDDLPSLPLRVTIACEGCRSMTRTLDAETEEIVVRLDAWPQPSAVEPWNVRGAVRDIHGAPIAGAAASTQRNLAVVPAVLVRETWQMRSRADGVFELEPHERCLIVVHHDAYASSVVGPLEPNATVDDLQVVLRPRVGLAGVVVDPEGRPCGEIPVRAWAVAGSGATRAETQTLRSTTSAVDGTFAFPDLAAGDYELRAYPPERLGASIARAVATAGNHATLVLGTGADERTTITGTVLDAHDGRPMAGADITVAAEVDNRFGADGGPWSVASSPSNVRSTVEAARTTTGADGTFRCLVPVPGRLTVTVDAPRHAFHESTVEPDADLAKPLRVVLTPACVLRLRLRASDGKLANGMTVAIEGEAGAMRILRDVKDSTYLAREVHRNGRVDLVGVPRERVTLVIGRDLDDPVVPRHRVEVDARSVGEEIVDVVVPD